VRWLTLPFVFGLGVLVGREAVSPAASAWLPVTGVSERHGSEHATLAAPESVVVGDADGESALGAASVATANGDVPGASKPSARASLHVQQAAHAASKGAARSWSELAASAQRGTVGILAGERYGAGIIVSRSGLVLTNLHVVQGIEKISALLLNDETAEAEVVEQAADVDLALLQLSRTVPDAAPLGSSGAVQVGDEVLAVGSPRKMFFSVSRGMVSYLKRKLESVEYIQTDLPINAGNSGGPLVDREGRVIGVVSFVLRESQGISFALPIDYALERFKARLSPSTPQ